jgi:nicotinamide riboside kinase
MLLGSRIAEADEFDSHADHYLLCDVDFPWHDDGTRYFSDQQSRKSFFEKCERELQRRSLPYTVIRGEPEARLAVAVAVVDRLLAAGPPHRGEQLI